MGRGYVRCRDMRFSWIFIKRAISTEVPEWSTGIPKEKTALADDESEFQGGSREDVSTSDIKLKEVMNI